jgi:hypothetical protein
MRIADLAFVFLVGIEDALDLDRQHGSALPDEKPTLLLLTGFPQAEERAAARCILRWQLLRLVHQIW